MMICKRIRGLCAQASPIKMIPELRVDIEDPTLPLVAASRNALLIESRD